MNLEERPFRADCLCVGPRGSGKTLLLKSLRTSGSTSVDWTSSSGPTVGNSLYRISVDKGDSNSNSAGSGGGGGSSVSSANGSQNSGMNSIELTVCEIGGALAPLWPRFYQDMTKVMFVVDASNLCQISAAGVLLYSLLAHPALRQSRILLVLSKMDASYRQMRNEALLMLQMKRLQEQVPQEITVLETSSFSKEGLDNVKNWLAAKDSFSSISYLSSHECIQTLIHLASLIEANIVRILRRLHVGAVTALLLSSGTAAM